MSVLIGKDGLRRDAADANKAVRGREFMRAFNRAGVCTTLALSLAVCTPAYADVKGKRAAPQQPAAVHTQVAGKDDTGKVNKSAVRALSPKEKEALLNEVKEIQKSLNLLNEDLEKYNAKFGLMDAKLSLTLRELEIHLDDLQRANEEAVDSAVRGVAVAGAGTLAVGALYMLAVWLRMRRQNNNREKEG